MLNGLTILNSMTAKTTLEKTLHQKYPKATVPLLFHTFHYKHLQSISAETRTVSNQPAFTCSKSTIQTLEKDVKYVQS